MFSIKVSVDGPRCDLLVAGEVDLATSGQLIDMGRLGLRQAAVHRLVIDLGGVSFLDASGIGAFIALRNLSLELGKNLQLDNLSVRVSRLLVITGLEMVFAVGPTAALAITA
jgi:anti-sigma B factor antagonist